MMKKKRISDELYASETAKDLWNGVPEEDLDEDQLFQEIKELVGPDRGVDWWNTLLRIHEQMLLLHIAVLIHGCDKAIGKGKNPTNRLIRQEAYLQKTKKTTMPDYVRALRALMEEAGEKREKAKRRRGAAS